ncbi:MAG: UDP-N-acetylglucosamine 2-epimerase [Nanoarchaeota archaeon]|nr:UDP-N-acetylglucosamine 2-epimerase [Nanoarchaeota archaeon]MBU0977101.1 UDP-N-acetylglucosamine 2-epimerase [Nanoarchaeota archaeon]
MGVYFVFGTKAELIKAAGILREMGRRKIPYFLVHTGQHAHVEEECKTFGLPMPHYRITQRKENLKTVREMAFWLIKGFFSGMGKNIFRKGDLVLVHGDTESTLLTTIIAKLKRCKLAHIEGGLRSWDIINPFPEEAIRRFTDTFSDYIFVPNDWAASNLRKTKKKGEVINTYLNPSYDSLKYTLSKKTHIEIPKGKYVVVLFHRKENLYMKDSLYKGIKIIREIVNRHKTLFVLSKNSKHVLKKTGFYDELARNKNVTFKDYYDFKDFVHVVNGAEFVATDGGSLQEETYLLNKPILLLRKKTERIEGLGETACLTNFDFKKAMRFLDNYKSFKRKGKVGDRKPSEIICDKIEEIIK